MGSDHFADISKMIDLGKGTQRNNLAVRKMLIERGVKPETLPPSEDTDKVKRRLNSEEKKILKDVKKIQGMKK